MTIGFGTFGNPLLNMPDLDPNHVPLKDVNGVPIFHADSGMPWYADEPRPEGWHEGGADPTGADVADATEAVGNDPDAIKEWLVVHNLKTDHIPEPDYTPNVDDDVKPPDDGLNRLQSWSGTKRPASVVAETPAAFTFESLNAAFANVSPSSGVDLGYSSSWTVMGEILEENTRHFATEFAALQGWDGKTADALRANVATFTDPAQGPIADMATGLKALSILEYGFSQMMLWVALDLHNDTLLYEVLLNRYPHQHDRIINEFNSHAQKVLAVVYNPAVSTIASNNPSFGTAPPVSVDPNNPSGQQGGGAGAGGGAGDNIPFNFPNLGDLGKDSGGGDPDSDGSKTLKDLGLDPDTLKKLGLNDPNLDPDSLKDLGVKDPSNIGDSGLNDPNLTSFSPAASQGLNANLPPGMNPADIQSLTGSNIPGLPGVGTDGATGLGGLSDLSNAFSSATGAATGPAGAVKSIMSDPTKGEAGVSGAAGQAADAAGQALNALTGKGGAPEGALGLGPKGLKAFGGSGDHAGGGGAGLGARGLVPFGPAGIPVAAVTKGGVDPAGAGVGSLAGSAAGGGGSAGGGSGSGGGGGGQRGPTGREHKANKALHRKRNGEDIIGDVAVVVPVLGQDEGQQRTGADESGQQPARTSAGRAAIDSAPMRSPTVPSGTPGQTVSGR